MIDGEFLVVVIITAIISCFGVVENERVTQGYYILNPRSRRLVTHRDSRFLK